VGKGSITFQALAPWPCASERLGRELVPLQREELLRGAPDERGSFFELEQEEIGVARAGNM
jgi:hypothetical protein